VKALVWSNSPSGLGLGGLKAGVKNSADHRVLEAVLHDAARYGVCERSSSHAPHCRNSAASDCTFWGNNYGIPMKLFAYKTQSDLNARSTSRIARIFRPKNAVGA